MLEFVRSFYNYSKFVQWPISLASALTSISLLLTFFFTLFFPLNFLLIPIFKTAGHFSLTPLLKLSGLLKYHSPLFLTVNYNESKWEIHNGTTFDYVINMRWAQRGFRARQMTINYYLVGLLNLINELKSRKNLTEIEVTGTSYFIGENTISKIGFCEEKVRVWQKILFVVDYVTLFIMYSFSRGRISFPNIFKLKKIKIRGDKLVLAEGKLLRYLKRVGN